jgi:hypothetical protein
MSRTRQSRDTPLLTASDEPDIRTVKSVPNKKGFEAFFDHEINVSNAGLGNQAIKALCSNLVDNTYVKTLNIAGNSFDEYGVRQIAEMLKTNKTIQTLNMKENWLMGSDVKILREGLEQNTTLHSLTFDRHMATEDDLEAMDYILANNRKASSK